MVEDNQVNQKLAEIMFSQMAHTLTLLERGEDALNLVQDEQFDLIFMDINLPGINGYEVSQQIREKLGQETPPIIALTAGTIEDDDEAFRSSGMSDFIAKPLSKVDFKNAVQKWGSISP